MNRTRSHKTVRHFHGMLAVLLLLAPGALHAQPQQKKPAKPKVSAGSKNAEDPLALLLQQAVQSIDKMDFAAALDPLQKYIAERPNDAYAHFQLGYAYAGLKRSQDALSEFSRAVALDPKMEPAYLNLGLVEMQSDPAAAAEAFRHASELKPGESRPRFLEGFSLEHAGKLPEAIERYRAALALSPNDYEIHFALGRALLRTNDAAGAEKQFRMAIAVRGDVAAARLGLANALLEQKKYQDASGALADYLKLNPTDRAAHFDRASTLLNLNQLDDALAELDLAQAGSAPTMQTLKMRGDIYTRQKEWSKAAEVLTQAIRQSPQDEDLARWLGHVELELRNYPAAINILGQVNHRFPKDADTLSDLANALFLNENYSAALAAMDRLDALEPPKPGSWFIRAICYDKLLRRAEAMDAYQKFLDQDNGQHDTQDFQARHRIIALQGDLGETPKKKKK